jgi:hypothetical protein
MISFHIKLLPWHPKYRSLRPWHTFRHNYLRDTQIPKPNSKLVHSGACTPVLPLNRLCRALILRLFTPTIEYFIDITAVVEVTEHAQL